MKKILVLIFSILLILSLLASAFGGSKQVTGDVVKISPDNNTLTVKGRKGDVSISVNDKTKILEEEMKTLSDVEVGDKVTVKYSDSGAEKTANSIAIKGVQAKQAEASGR